jgi:hypothetical protein
MIANDQLTIERKKGTAFKDFHEAPVTFPPTYKYRITTSPITSQNGSFSEDALSPNTLSPPTPLSPTSPQSMDGSILTMLDDHASKVRIPSWTDRILYKSNLKDSALHIKPITYTSFMDFITSDHKPVAGVFSFAVLDATSLPLQDHKETKKKKNKKKKKNPEKASQVCSVQ